MEALRTESGIEHGCIESIANSVTAHEFKNIKDAKKREQLNKDHKHAMELVEAEYINLSNQENGRFEQWYGGSWPGEPQRKFVCLSGHKYVIPRGLMDQVNNEMGEIQRSGLIGTDGRELIADGAKKIQTHRFMFLGKAA